MGFNLVTLSVSLLQPGGGGGPGPGGGGLNNGANGAAAHLANGSGGHGGPGSHAGGEEFRRGNSNWLITQPILFWITQPNLRVSGSVLLPDYSVYAGTPSHVAAQRVRANAPGFVAESELKMDILKRQHICLAQVRSVMSQQARALPRARNIEEVDYQIRSRQRGIRPLLSLFEKLKYVYMYSYEYLQLPTTDGGLSARF